MSLPAVNKALLTHAGSAHADTPRPSTIQWSKSGARLRRHQPSGSTVSCIDLNVWYDPHPYSNTISYPKNNTNKNLNEFE